MHCELHAAQTAKHAHSEYCFLSECLDNALGKNSSYSWRFCTRCARKAAVLAASRSCAHECASAKTLTITARGMCRVSRHLGPAATCQAHSRARSSCWRLPTPLRMLSGPTSWRAATRPGDRTLWAQCSLRKAACPPFLSPGVIESRAWPSWRPWSTCC